MDNQQMNEKVIADLSRKNLELTERVNDLEKATRSIDTVLYCIGGPLNDNILEYSNKQLATFFRIKDLIRGLE